MGTLAVRRARSRAVLLAVIAGLVLAGGAVPAGAAVPVPAHSLARTAVAVPVPVVVDTDLGVDDLVALAWIVADGSLDVRAVTLSGTGRATCPAGLAGLRRWLSALGAGAIPTACGPSVPIAAGIASPDADRAAADALHGLSLPAAPAEAEPAGDAVALLGALIDGASDPTAVVALGPLTTLAAVIDADPGRAFHLATVIASAGTLAEPGDLPAPTGGTPPPTERNAAADPGALDAVLRSGAPLTLVTLDAIANGSIPADLPERLAAGGETTEADLVGRLVRAAAAGGEPIVVRDALATLALPDPGLLVARGAGLEVARRDPAPGALLDAPDGPRAVVAAGADGPAFAERLVATLRDTAQPAPEPTPTAVLAIAGGDGSCTFDVAGSDDPGLALLHVASVGEPFVAILAGLAAGYAVTDLADALAAIGTDGAPPGWLRIVAYVEVAPGDPRDDPVELRPGRYVAACLTGDGATPVVTIADGMLEVIEP